MIPNRFRISLTPAVRRNSYGIFDLRNIHDKPATLCCPSPARSNFAQHTELVINMAIIQKESQDFWINERLHPGLCISIISLMPSINSVINGNGPVISMFTPAFCFWKVNITDFIFFSMVKNLNIEYNLPNLVFHGTIYA